MSTIVEEAEEVIEAVKEKLYKHPKDLHQKTFGEKAADAVAEQMGSWHFIIIQTIIIILWILYNIFIAVTWLKTGVFDPFPFILLNLLFSTQAAYAAPIIMMSQNRSAAVDRSHAENAYHQIDEVYSNLMGAIDTIRCLDEKQDEQIVILDREQEVMMTQHETMIKDHKLMLETLKELSKE